MKQDKDKAEFTPGAYALAIMEALETRNYLLRQSRRAHAENRAAPDTKVETAPGAKVEAATVTTTPGDEKALPWWQQDYDIKLQAKIAGDSLRRQKKTTSNRKIGEKIALHIEQEELRGQKRKAPSGRTIGNTVLKGWAYTAD